MAETLNEKNSRATAAKMEKEQTISAAENLKEDNETAELVNTLKRVQADFENYQKRTTKEKEQSIHYGKALAFKEILEFVDSFDSALAHVQDAHRKGMENLRTQLLKILERNGIKPISTVGKKFDPALHECLMQGNDSAQGEDMVLEEFQKGYMFNGHVLRTAKVKVNTHTQPKSSSDEKQGGNQNE